MEEDLHAALDGILSGALREAEGRGDAKQLAGRQREEEEEVLLAAEAEAEAAEEATTAVPRLDRYAAATDMSSIRSVTASRECDESRRFAAIAEGRTR